MRQRSDRRIDLRLPATELARIDAAAERDGRSRADWMRRACARAAGETTMDPTIITSMQDAWDQYNDMCGSDHPSITIEDLRSARTADPAAPAYGTDWTAWLSALYEGHEHGK